MNNEQDFRDSELLESPLDAAIKETLAEPLPEEAIERVKTRAKLLAQSAAPTDTQTSRASNGSHRVCEETVGQAARLLDLSQKTNRRAACSTNDPQALRVRWGASVVAAMVLLVAATTLLIDRSASHAFAQVVEKMKAINSVRLMMVTQFGKQPEVASQMRLSGQLMRVEVNGGQLIQLADFEQKKMLLLDPQRKLSQSLDLDTEAAKGLINNPVEQLRRAKSDDAVALGEELLNGRRTQLYRLKKVDLLGITGSDEMLVWVDLASNLPAKIVVRDTDPKASTEIRFEGFVWGESQDAKLFSLSVPEGYQPAEIVLPRSTNPPTLSNGSESSAPVIVDGVIRDRVPGRIVWSHDGTAITALVRDPEAVPVQNQKPNELRQWDVASGKLRWSEVVAGANALATSADGKLLATVIWLRDAVARRRIGQSDSKVDDRSSIIGSGFLAGRQDARGEHHRMGSKRWSRRQGFWRRADLGHRAIRIDSHD